LTFITTMMLTFDWPLRQPIQSWSTITSESLNLEA